MTGNINILRVVVMIIAIIVNLNETLKQGCQHRKRLSKGLRASRGHVFGGSFWQIIITTMKMAFCKKTIFQAYKVGKSTYILYCVWFWTTCDLWLLLEIMMTTIKMKFFLVCILFHIWFRTNKCGCCQRPVIKWPFNFLLWLFSLMYDVTTFPWFLDLQC